MSFVSVSLIVSCDLQLNPYKQQTFWDILVTLTNWYGAIIDFLQIYTPIRLLRVYQGNRMENIDHSSASLFVNNWIYYLSQYVNQYGNTWWISHLPCVFLPVLLLNYFFLTCIKSLTWNIHHMKADYFLPMTMRVQPNGKFFSLTLLSQLTYWKWYL